MRKVLVTGAYGFLGRRIGKIFSEMGCGVTGLGHGDWSTDQWKAGGFQNWISCEITAQTLAAHADQPDIIFHCAGGASVAVSVASPESDFHRTVDTTRSVLEYIQAHVPNARLVLPSSAAVYGNVARLPIVEDTPAAPISPYGLHKRLSEELCETCARDYGLKVAIVRLFSVYGPGLRKQLLWDACEKLSRGDSIFFGTGQERRDWLHVDDAVSLLTVAAQQASDRCPIVNGGTGKAVTVAEVLQRLAAKFSEAKPPRFSGTAREGDPAGYEADISRAQEWKWRPQVGIDQGIADYAKWYLEHAPKCA